MTDITALRNAVKLQAEGDRKAGALKVHGHRWAARAALLVGAQRAAEHHTRAWLTLNGPATDSQTAAALQTLAYLLARRGASEAYAEATTLLERATDLQPQAAAAWFNLGYVQQQAGQHAAALGALRQALALSPELDRAWYGLGLSLLQLGQTAEALEAFQTNTRLQPHSPHGWAGCARAQLQLGDAEAARATLDHLRQFEPRAARALQLELQAAWPQAFQPLPRLEGDT